MRRSGPLLHKQPALLVPFQGSGLSLIKFSLEHQHGFVLDLADSYIYLEESQCEASAVILNKTDD